MCVWLFNPWPCVVGGFVLCKGLWFVWCGCMFVVGSNEQLRQRVNGFLGGSDDC